MRQPEIRCVDVVEQVTDWMEQPVDGDWLAFEEHLSVCPHCTEYVDQLRRALEVLDAADRQHEAPPTAAREALLEAFRAQRSAESP